MLNLDCLLLFLFIYAYIHTCTYTTLEEHWKVLVNNATPWSRGAVWILVKDCVTSSDRRCVFVILTAYGLMYIAVSYFSLTNMQVSTSSRTKYTQSSHICFSLLDNDAAYILEITRDFWILEICLDFKCSK